MNLRTRLWMASLPGLEMLDRMAVVIAAVDPWEIRQLNLRNDFIQSGAEVTHERFIDWIGHLSTRDFIHVMLLGEAETDDDADYEDEEDEERTALAEGTKLKAGMTRRIAVTMTEADFFAFRDLAVAEGRSLADVVVRYARMGVNGVVGGPQEP